VLSHPWTTGPVLSPYQGTICRSGRHCQTWLYTVESEVAPLNIGLATAYQASTKSADMEVARRNSYAHLTSHVMMMVLIKQGWQWHQPDHMQTTALRSRQIIMPARHHSPNVLDAQPTVSKHFKPQRWWYLATTVICLSLYTTVIHSVAQRSF